jgi:hypothetical protein
MGARGARGTLHDVERLAPQPLVVELVPSARWVTMPPFRRQQYERNEEYSNITYCCINCDTTLFFFRSVINLIE